MGRPRRRQPQRHRQLPRHRKRRAAQSAVGQPERCLVFEPAGRHLRPGREHRHDRPRLGRQQHLAQLATGSARTAATTRASTSGTQPAHQAFVGTKGNAGAVVLVNNSASQVTGGLPGFPFDNHRSGGAPPTAATPTPASSTRRSGRRRVLKTGIFTTLRLDDPQANQTLRCDPDYAQGQEFSAFRYGCKPWYGANPFTNGTVVEHHHEAVPRRRPVVLEQHDAGPVRQELGRRTPGVAFSRRPACRPARSATTSPSRPRTATNINNNSCQQFACNYDGNYDGKPGNPTTGVGDTHGRRLAGYPRVVNLFIVPYQGGKGLTGAGDTIPVLGFASFYVMNWTGANGNQSDPCPDRTWNGITCPRPPEGGDHRRVRRDGRLRARPGRSACDLRRGTADAVQGQARPMNCR